MVVESIADLPRIALSQFGKKPVIIIRKTAVVVLSFGLFVRPQTGVDPVPVHFLTGKLPEIGVIGIRTVKDITVFIGNINQQRILDREFINEIVQVFFFTVLNDLFCSGADIARTYTEEFGLSLGIGGMLLMKREYRKELEEALITTPIEYLLLETDGPYVKPERPENVTGKRWTKARNTSLILPAIAERVAEIKGMAVDDVIRITAENTRKVFKIK